MLLNGKKIRYFDYKNLFLRVCDLKQVNVLSYSVELSGF